MLKNMITKETKILIAGLGLIGGGYAKGLHKKGYTVYAVNRSRKAIDYALTEGFIDKGASEEDELLMQELLSEADIIVIAVYPKAFIDWVQRYHSYFKKGAIVTDVTGVKSCIVYDVQDILGSDVEYIASHPMAGRELSGVENSDESVFEGANYIVVPTEKNTKEAIDTCMELGKLLDFGRYSVLSPKEHDDIIGFVSQLTHCIAIGLMNCSDNEKLVNYVGDSFRDLTRIARINENMWTELFLLNKESLVGQLDLFIKEMQDIRDLLENENTDELKNKMIISTNRRVLFDKKKGN